MPLLKLYRYLKILFLIHLFFLLFQDFCQNHIFYLMLLLHLSKLEDIFLLFLQVQIYFFSHLEQLLKALKMLKYHLQLGYSLRKLYVLIAHHLSCIHFEAYFLEHIYPLLLLLQNLFCFVHNIFSYLNCS